MSPDQLTVHAATLRPATPEDESFQLELYAGTRDDLNLLDWDENQKRVLIEMQFRAQSSQYSLSYPQADNSIILIEGRRVGRLIVDRDAQGITLVDIAVLPSDRGAGIGTSLIRELVKEGAALGRAVQLHVLKSNPAQKLYLRLGFSIVGEDSLYFQMKSEKLIHEPAAKSAF